jgi:hypothetical protein
MAMLLSEEASRTGGSLVVFRVAVRPFVLGTL